MNPERLKFLLTVTLQQQKQNHNCSLSLASSLYIKALTQLQTRWPLDGCGIKYGGWDTHVIAVGRN